MDHRDPEAARPGASLQRAVLAAVLAVLVAPGLAEDLLALEPAFDNTIVSTYDDGESAKLWLDRDGRYRGQGKRGDPSSGRWSVKGEKLCLKQARPLPMPFAYCTAIVPGSLGTTWRGKSVFGEPLTFELAPGR